LIGFIRKYHFFEFVYQAFLIKVLSEVKYFIKKMTPMNKILITVSLLTVITFQSCNLFQKEATYYGHWKCDRTGTVKMDKDQGVSETNPIIKLYDLFELEAFEFEILENGQLKFHDRKLDGTHKITTKQFIKNYQNDPSKILIDPDDDEGVIQFSDITANSLKAIIYAEDDMTYYVNMKRVNRN